MHITEIKTVFAMIQMYCRHFHPNSKELCSECKALFQYAEKRILNCTYGLKKPACNKCAVHCFKSDMREKIKQVMRWSGPKMIYKHPVLSIKHIFKSFCFLLF